MGTLGPRTLSVRAHFSVLGNSPFLGLLIADDTGLGKTAEAGLILFRLMQKRRADRVLVLKAQPEPERWQRELTEKFGIETVVINDNDDFKRLRRAVPAHLNLFAYYPVSSCRCTMPRNPT